VRAQCYTTLVRPLLEYSSAVWDPHTQRNIDKLEAVQRRAARFIVNDYSTYSSVTDMLNRLGLPTLRERRAQARVVVFYKVINNRLLVPYDHLTPHQSRSRKGHNKRYLLPHTRLTVYQRSFFPDAIRLWNDLPSDVVNLELDAFKMKVQSLALRG